ncbi:MAG: alpha/beta fold hydrolase [Rhodospirillales bacterium]
MAPLRKARVDGRTIAFREAGAGPALVLLHGIGGASQTWANQLDSFAARFKVIAWDAPGYGGSDDLAHETPSPDDYARALAGLLDKLKVERAHVVGQSAGAPIAAAFCRLFPPRALSFTFCHGLAGTAMLAPEAREAARRARLEPFAALGPAGFAAARGPGVLGPGAAPALVTDVVATMAAVRPAGYRGMVEMLARADVIADAPRIAAPALVMCGGADKVAPEAACRAVADALGAAFALLPGVGHYGCLEDPAAFDTALAAFLDRAGGGC